MFEQLDRLPDDPILGLMAAFRADADARKVDLGVGVYRDDRGETPVPAAVRRAEQAIYEKQTTKAYVAPAGNAAFNSAMEQFVLGDGHPALASGRVRTVQTPGGCGALRLGAELIRVSAPQSTVHVSTPTWANHVPLLGGSGLKLERYSYYDARTAGVDFNAVLGALERLPSGAVVLLHACCHNPCGADLSEAQWRELVPLFQRRRLLPFLDMAYQGLGVGLDEDAFAVRLFAAELPEVLIAVSCSKNFGLYRERVGTLHVVCETAAAAAAALSQLVRIARTMYSMPPDHGAAIVQEILSSPTLRESWAAEVGAMRERILSLRGALVTELARVCPQQDFGFVTRQRGMFSYFGLTPAQVHSLRERHHIYMTDDSRINVAGLRAQNIGYFAQSVAQVL